MVMLHPDKGATVESWTAEGNANKMRAEFADFEPRYVMKQRPFFVRDVANGDA